MKIYIIRGLTGEYSDRRDWPVRAYLDLGQAQLQRGVMSARAAEKADLWKAWRYDYTPAGEAAREEVRKYVGDPDFDSDYNDTTYFLEEVDLADFGWPELETTQYLPQEVTAK